MSASDCNCIHEKKGKTLIETLVTLKQVGPGMTGDINIMQE